ncbi:MAG: lamin tail domain-containing protein [Bacteroidales bacterium]|nr:lamin tail domain-containing protein [Bacteroidales bacterium]
MKKNLLKILLTFFIALSIGWVNGQTTILQESFETDGHGTRYTASSSGGFNDGTSDHFNRTDGSDISNVTGAYTAFDGTYFWGAEDTDDGGGDASKEQTIVFNTIDISGYTSITLKGLFGAGNENGPGSSAYDIADYIKVVYSINGGAEQNGIWFSYERTADDYNEPIGLDADFDGEADVNGTNRLGTAMQEFSCNIPDGSTLDLTIKVYMDGASEEIGFDNIRVTGEVPVLPATFDPADGETFIAIDKTITITFDEKIYKSDGTTEIVDGDLSTLITFKETDAAGADVPATMTYSNADPFVITIDPTSNLTNSTDYYVEFGPVYNSSGEVNTSVNNTTFTTIPTNYIQLTNPVGGEKYYAGDEVTVTWGHANVTTVDIFAFVPANDAWELMVDDTPCDGTEAFTIPSDAGYSDLYKIAVMDISDTTVMDSSLVLTVVSTPTINDIQSDNDGDLSNYDGHIVITSGIVTAIDGGNYFIQDGTGEWNGIQVNDGTNTPAIGDSITIEASVEEDYDLTRLNSVTSYTLNNSGNTLPDASVITTVTLGESYEGVLVKIIDAEVTNPDASFGQYEINDGSGALLTDDDIYAYAPVANDDITITGIGHYSYSERKLLARDADDILSATDTVGSAVYAVDQGLLEITDIPFSTSLVVFKNNMEEADTATFNVFDADGTTPAGTLDDTKLLIVTAADGITSSTYTITRNAVLTDATVTSSVYTVDDGLETITDVPNGTDLATFQLNITPPEQGSFVVYEADGTTPAGDLATGYKLIGTAEDGITEKTYVITVSDIVPDTDSEVVDPTTQVATATVAVVDGDEDAEAFEVFSFDINDAGTADGIDTKVSQIVLFYGPNMTIDFDTEIDSGYFEVDGVPVELVGEPVFGVDSVAFPIADEEISVTDGGSVNVILYLILQPTVADGKIIQFFVDADQHGFETKGITSEFVSTFSADVVGNDITIDVLATDLNFSTQPTNVYIGDAITPAVVVEAVDANGNIDTDYVTDISITAAGATLDGTPVAETPTAGVATFDALSFSAEGTGTTLTAASGTLNSEISSTFNVSEVATTDLFISEIIEPDGGNNKAIEIYNPTDSDVDLSAYSIKYSNNGGGWGTVSDAADTRAVLPLSGTLTSKDVYVIINEEADAGNTLHTEADLKITADYSTPDACDGCNVTSFNGNDAVGLFKDDVLIDAFGEPLSDATISVAGNSTGGQNHTILRKAGIVIGNTDWTASSGTNETDSEWTVEDANYFDDLGSYLDNLSTEAFVTSTEYTVDDGAKTITDVPAGETLADFESNLTPASGADFETYEADGSTVATDLASDYKVIVTAEDGTTTKTYTVTVLSSTGISDVTANYKLYPNPSNGLFKLELNNTDKEKFFVEVYDIIGIMVYKARVSENITTIDLTQMNAGIYYVSINNGDNRKVSKIIIK